MSYVITLDDYAPPARVDGRAFTKARIEEAPAITGAWLPVQTLTLSPVDADPAHPVTRELTTGLAQYATGWYRVVWIDAEGHETPPTEAVENTAPGGVRPSVAEVASKVRARTRVKGGGQAGTFTASTNPSADDVEDLISEALDEVLGKVREPEAATDYERRVRGAVALYTAILIELSYYPEQVGSGKSPAATYQALYASRIKALIAEGETGEVQGEGGTADSPADAAWTFPVGVGGLIGWRSRWR